MKLSEVEELMNKFDSSSLREFSWTNASDQLSFSKNQNQTVSAPVAPAPANENFVATSSETATDDKAATPAEDKAADSSDEAAGNDVKSPLVGVVYLQAGPDKPAFIKVGDHVKKGQTLLIIEAMKVMNEIPAPADGEITAIMVKTNDVVEYDQPLVKINR